jgi:DNA repair protein RadC
MKEHTLINSLFSAKEKIETYKVKELLDATGGLRGIANLDAQDLINIAGITQLQADRIIAATQVGREVLFPKEPQMPMLGSEDMYKWFYKLEGCPVEERLWVVALDVRQNVLGYRLVGQGSIQEVTVSLGLILRYPIQVAAPRIILVHSHPSGDPGPSETDARLTSRVFETGKQMSIELVDHIIVGQGKYYSFADKGLL